MSRKFFGLPDDVKQAIDLVAMEDAPSTSRQNRADIQADIFFCKTIVVCLPLPGNEIILGS